MIESRHTTDKDIRGAGCDLAASIGTCAVIPNFLYIGTSKAGSTWIYNVLSHHADIYMAPGKGLYFFDGHYDRGLAWYLSQFTNARDEAVVGEVSHSYLFSVPACDRIAELNPDMKLMVCLREPAERAFSAYLDGVKNGQIHTSFEESLKEEPSLIDRGRYATHLRPYIERFGRQNIHVGVFDELKSSPASFAGKLYKFLDVAELDMADSLTKKVMPAARPRSRLIAKLAKKVSYIAKRFGLKRLQGLIKTSRVVRNLLYRQYTDRDKPRMDPDVQQRLRNQFQDEILALDRLLGSNFQELWKY